MTTSFTSAAMSPMDTEINYTLMPTNDRHAITAAQKGVNNENLTIKSVNLPYPHETLIFQLQELVAVELGRTETDMGHDCSCSDYNAASPCSHIYWALDQVARAHSPGQHTRAALSNDGGRLVVRLPTGALVDPMVVTDHISAASVQTVAQQHVHPLRRFHATIEKETNKLTQTIMRLTDRNYVALDVAGARSYSARQAHSALATSASNLFDSFQAYKTALWNTRAAPETIREAVDDVARVYVSMIRAVVMRAEPAGLRSVAATAYDEDAPDGFWHFANLFFMDARNHLAQSERRDLLLVCRYMYGPSNEEPRLPMRTRADESVLQLIQEWVGQ